MNIVNQKTYDKLGQPSLRTPDKPVFPYGSKKPLPILGVFTTDIAYDQRTTTADVYVSKTGTETLMSFSTGTQLGLIHISYNVTSPVTTENIVNNFQDRFEGIGKLKDTQCKLHVDDTVTPVAQPHRRIPFHLRKKVETEINKLLDMDIVEPVGETPTPWISPIHVVNKPKNPDEIRMCVDMRMANQAIQRERHLTPTIDDILASLNGATVFSKLDLNSGYHQIELAEESRFITVFTTHVGLYRFKRLSFGINSAAELFQNQIQSALGGLEGVLNISDDILVFGCDQQEHDARLEACMQRIRDKNLTLNRNKCQFSTPSIEFFGHVFSEQGVSPDPKKVEALKQAEGPKNRDEVRSLLGLATYCARFCFTPNSHNRRTP